METALYLISNAVHLYAVFMVSGKYTVLNSTERGASIG